MGLLAVSLCLRTFIYAVGVLAWVGDSAADRLGPDLAGGRRGQRDRAGLAALPEALPAAAASAQLAVPRHHPVQRGRTVCLIQLSQAVISTADLLVVGLLSSWWDVGRYGAPHRMVTAIADLRLIFQQAAFPTLSRLWRHTARAGREALDSLVEVLVTGLVPVAVGGTVLAEPLVRLLLPADYAGAGPAAGLGIWRAPLLILAFLYQTTLIALNRESRRASARWCSRPSGSGPWSPSLRLDFGLPGAAAAVLLLGLGLVLAGYGSLAREGRQPAWHHHLARPLAASLAMIPVCLVLQHWHVLLAVSAAR